MSKKLVCLITVVILAASLLSGCGSSSSSTQKSDAAPSATAASPSANNKNQSSPLFDSKTEKDNGTSITSGASSGGAGTGETGTNAILQQRKVIRNSNITVEVEDFDQSYGKIKTLINGIGYVQDANIKTVKQYGDDSKERLVKRGIIVIRVDKLKFEDVISGIRGIGLLVEESVKSDDVTDQYFDTESRVRLLKFEQARLEEYLKKLTDPDTIFKTEDKLTDVMHQIESYTGTLKKWDDLVQLSTITINLNETHSKSSVPEEKNSSFGSKLSDGFIGTLKAVIGFLGTVLIILVGALPVLVLVGGLTFAGIKLYRRFYKKKPSGPNSGNNNNFYQ